MAADPNDLSGRLAKQRGQLDRQSAQIAELKSAVTALGKRLHPVEHASRHREVEHGGLAIQIGVVEGRIGLIEERLRGGEPVIAEEDEWAEARSLLELVRREHEQIRVRMQVIAQYEERLRRLEDAVVKSYQGDVRHPF